MSTSNSSLDADGLRIWSCVTCRRRKVRCDRREPCVNCVRNSVDCHYPTSGRIPRRRALPAGHNAGRSLKERHADLISRIRRLESVVTELSAQVEDGVGDDVGESVSVEIPRHHQEEISEAVEASNGGAENVLMANESERMEDIGQMIIAKGGTLHVGKGFWTAFCGEVENIFRAVGDGDDDEFSRDSAEASLPSISETALARTQDHGFVFSHHSERIGGLQPLPSQISFLWQTYLRSVDPFIKIIHTPSMTRTVNGLDGDIASRGLELEALLMAISLAAVVSLKEDEAATKFGRFRTELIDSFRRETESALARSEFMITQDLVIVQAFVIYLTVLPYIGQEKLAKSLMGVLLRVSTSLGLHKDGSHQTVMSFPDAEMRRRLWWQICLLDSRLRDHGTPQLSISEAMFDTAMPTNIGDEILQSALSELDVEESNMTDMALFLARCRVWRLGRTLEAVTDKPLSTQLDLVRSVKASVSSTLLLSVDLSKSFDSFVQAMIFLVFARIESFVYKRALKTVAKDQERTANKLHEQVLRTSAETANLAHILFTREDWSRWRWQLQGQAPWAAVGTALAYITQKPWTVESEKVLESARGLLQTLDGGIHAEGGQGTRIREVLESAMSCSHRQQWLAFEAPQPQQDSNHIDTQFSVGASIEIDRAKELSARDDASKATSTADFDSTFAEQDSIEATAEVHDGCDLDFMGFLNFDDILPF